jgi:GNAT superfamily N-acetyltransferase
LLENTKEFGWKSSNGADLAYLAYDNHPQYRHRFHVQLFATIRLCYSVQRVGVMTSGIIIHPAAWGDFDRVCDLYCRSVKSNPKGFIQDLNFHGCIIQKMQHWREAGGDLLVATAGGAVAGFGGLAPHEGRRVELCKLHVDSEWQRRGIGRLLAAGLIGYACKAGFSEVELHVTATQTAAIALYRRLGFIETRRSLFTASVFGEPVLFDTIYMSFAVTGDNSSISAATSS